MSNPNHVFVGLPALIKNAAASDPIVSAGDNHISGIGFFDAITGGTVNRDNLGENFRNTNFLAVVGTQVYFYTAAGVTDPDWTNGANWTELTNSDLTQALIDISNNAGNISTNAGAISNNASGISSNAGNIAINAGNISTNAGAISTNAGNITTLQGDLAQEILDRQNEDSALLGQIQSNDTDISNLQSSVAGNTSGISSNASAISSNVNSINLNAGDIATNAGNISTLNTTTVKKTDSIDELADVDTSTTAPNNGEVLVWDSNASNWVPGTSSTVGGLDDLSDVDLTSTLPELGQVLFYNGTNWIPEYPEITVEAKNATLINFTKGQAVYVSGTAPSGKPEIQLADNNGTNTYPAIGLLYDDIDAGAEGLVVISGSIFGLDTSNYTAGNALYVDSTPGALTATKPIGTSQIQKVAIVKRSNISAGSLIVMGAGRVNDLPNLPTGEYWRGDANGVPQPQSFDTDVTNSTQVQLNISAISTNASNISTNATDIATNTGDIATNTSAIATNASDISTLQTDTTGNLTDTVTVHSDVTNAGSGQIITSSERTLLNSAVQPLDNVSVLTNDASYITSAQAPVQDVNGLTGNVTLDADAIDDSTTTHKFTTAADITKLSGIEPNATADQTAAEIKTAYESNANTNEFSDAEQTKLAGIAAGAEVNVQADWNETNASLDSYIQNKPTSVADLTQHYVEVDLDPQYLKNGGSVMNFNNASPTLFTNLTQVQSIGSAITWSSNRFTVSSDGLYTFNASGLFNTVGIDRAQPTFYFYVNGTAQEGAATGYLRNLGTFDAGVNLTRTFNLTANDYVELYVENTGNTSGTAVRALGVVVEAYSHEYTVTGVNGTGFILNDSNVAAQPLRQYYASTASFPSATTWHGAIAHSHADGAMYFAHGGSWVKLGNDSDIFDGDYNSLINQPSIPVVGVDAQAYDANLTTFVSNFTLPTVDGSSGHVLTTNGSGTLSFAASGGSGSSTLLGLTDTPSTFGSTGQVLAVNSAGNAVEFVNQSGGSGAKRTLIVPSTNDYSGDVVTFGGQPASGSFVSGALYYYTGSNWELAFGSAQQTSIGLLALCVNTTTPELLVRGIITNSNLGTALTSGNRLYVSAVQGGTGKMMDSIPSSPASGSVLRAVGYVINGVNSQVMFDPSQDYITFP